MKTLSTLLAVATLVAARPSAADEFETPGSFLGTVPCPPSTGLTACKLVEDASGMTRSFGCQTTAWGVVTGGSDNDETWGVRGNEP